MSEHSSEYSPEQFSENYPDGMEDNYWIYARSKFVEHKLRKRLTPNDCILEIGCGTGIVLQHLLKAGLDCRGVELGRPKIPVEVQDRVITGVGFQDLDANYRSSITAVLLLDVLEHLANPEAFLQETADALPNSKVLMVTVPARAELWSNYDVHFGHYRRYSASALKSLMEGSGFVVDEIGYFFHTLYPLIFTFSRFGLERRVKNSAPRPVWLHRLAAYWYFFESLALPRQLWGSSLYALAHKAS